MGSEEAILEYLGIPHNYKDYLKVGQKYTANDDNDEAFVEEDEEEEATFMQNWKTKEIGLQTEKWSSLILPLSYINL